MSDRLSVVCRDTIEEDGAYIIDAWIRSFHQQFIGSFFQPWNGWKAKMTERIVSILARDTVFSLVAVLPEDPSMIIGYLVFEVEPSGRRVIHYVQTKHQFQGQGIAQLLLKKAGIDLTQPIYTTHVTDQCKRLKGRIRLIHVPEENIQ